MDISEARTVCILGRQPSLGLSELESLYGAGNLMPLQHHALLKIDSSEINFKRLGGTIKVAKILAVLPETDWPKLHKYLVENIPKHLKYLPEGPFTLGVSLYGLTVPLNKLNVDLLKLKKILRNLGRSARIVPNKSMELNAAQVLHNKLTRKGAWELLFIREGKKTILAQTMFVQDIDAYAARDQARPKRDARVGMLPPKLAQIIINLAVGHIEQKLRAEKANTRPLRLLDPFCGTGVVLQEALLMGYSIIGTDIEPRMVEYSKANIEWLVKNHPHIEGYATIEAADATNYHWPRFSAVASEVFLGRPLAKVPADADLKKIISDANTITKKFLTNIAPQLKNGQRLCLAVPAWMVRGQFKHLPVIDHLTDMGYNRLDLVHTKYGGLIYFREKQIVGRELLILEKRASDE